MGPFRIDLRHDEKHAAVQPKTAIFKQHRARSKLTVWKKNNTLRNTLRRVNYGKLLESEFCRMMRCFFSGHRAGHAVPEVAASARQDEGLLSSSNCFQTSVKESLFQHQSVCKMVTR